MDRRLLARSRKKAVYCSDGSRAFDRVSSERLIAKPRARKVRPEIVAVISSWLRQRTAHVGVGGRRSREVPRQDMVYQGSVLGPPLWNVFYEDPRRAVYEWFFEEIVYADDFNSYRLFNAAAPTQKMSGCIRNCHYDLHAWGRVN